MKTLITMLLPLLLTASMLTAQNSTSVTEAPALNIGTTSDAAFTLAVRNYRMGLEADNQGLVESSLYHAVCLRLKYPEKDLRALEAAVDRLVSKGASKTIRFKAYLASTVFASPDLIDCSKLSGEGDSTGFFADISAQLQNRLLVHNR
ncbi:MAG: hypothetical protein RRA94_11420 [Bacteroidota bacterium]|nr:hypothetical protein [Bacteroidota bacterium]